MPSLFLIGEHGLLFTGDTYYPAPIWLFRPETDLEAYRASIRRLAALAPQIKMVLGAHNIPVAPPSVLPRLVMPSTLSVPAKFLRLRHRLAKSHTKWMTSLF